MDRRTLLTASAAALASPVLGLPTLRALAQATPIASPEASPPVGSYGEIGAAYAAARNNLLTLGRPVVDQLMGSDPVALYSLFSPDVQAYVPQEVLATFRRTLETNRVHFELPQFGAIFDGHLAGQTIEGFFSQAGTLPFSLTADVASASTPATSGTPEATPSVDGRWTGQIATGDPPIDIVVTFRTTDDALSGTIDIPSQQVTGLPLENVSVIEEKPLGDRALELALPYSPDIRFYLAQYPWDNAAITLTVIFDASGNIISLTPAPEWPLPEDPAAGFVSTVSYQLPFDGVWWTFWGGDTIIENYHTEARNQRHAYDLIIWKDGATYRTDGTRNEDYWVWGQPLFAPAAGTIVSIHDDVPENTPGTFPGPDTHPAGNHIVLQTAETEFVYLAHVQPGSIRVQPGDQVAAGTVLALTGNSGNSSEPHLHIHIQNQADFNSPEAIGLPLQFSNYTADGAEVTSGTPRRGQLIARQ
jgi:hypothetical protein